MAHTACFRYDLLVCSKILMHGPLLTKAESFNDLAFYLISAMCCLVMMIIIVMTELVFFKSMIIVIMTMIIRNYDVM